MNWFLYQIVFSIFAMAYLPIFIAKGKHNDAFSERLGAVPKEIIGALKGKKVIWIHAVSVGETVLAFRLADLLRQAPGDFQFCFTTTTSTGREVARRLKKPSDHLFYFPLDFIFSVRAFIKNVNPLAVVIMETELWPNLIWELSAKKIPLFIMNGRISDKAIVKYNKIKFFLRPLLSALTGVGVQDESMRLRFVSLGARQEVLAVTGNMKYDWRPAEIGKNDLETLQRFVAASNKGFLCIAASTHEGEEEIFFKNYLQIKKSQSNFGLLIAPRHLDRIEAIGKRAASLGIKPVYFSEYLNPRTTRKLPAEANEVFILDRMGLLGNLYESADLVYVGGSLVSKGGHNPVEPAYFGKAILFGPSMDNFKSMAEEFIRFKAAHMVKDADDLIKEITALMKDKTRRLQMGQAAQALVLSHQGAADKSVKFMIKTMHSLRS